AILPHAVAMFHAGLSDPSGAVQAACHSALVAIDPIVHARLPAQLREPDSEEGIEAELQVPRMLRTEGSAASISAVLSAMHVDGPQAADDGYGGPAAEIPAAEGVKRPKYESTDPAPAPRQVEPPAAMPAAPPSGRDAQQDRPAISKPAAAPAPRPAARELTPAMAGDGSDSDGEEIPDIVMEDSDEDEE
ncbi:hypothetical protein IWQ57_006828, partial [Coemansia nantahalensis]